MAAETDSRPRAMLVLSKATLNAARYLGLSHVELPQILGISKSSVSGLASFEHVLDKCRPAGERALMLVRICRALDTLVGGDAVARITWMNAHNKAIGGVPRHAIQTHSSLVHTLAYLNGLVVAASGGHVSRL